MSHSVVWHLLKSGVAACGRDMVVALQTELPVEEGISAEKAVADAERKAAAGLVSLDPRDPTRAIIAAMTNAVTGVVSPIERHCTVKRGIATVRTDSPRSRHALSSHPG